VRLFIDELIIFLAKTFEDLKENTLAFLLMLSVLVIRTPPTKTNLLDDIV
jgi:hypothetical protein